MNTIAKIIPLKRMPRNLGGFDYALPESLQEKIAVGQLVIIPLRKTKIVGLVSGLTKGESESLKEVDSILTSNPIAPERVALG